MLSQACYDKMNILGNLKLLIFTPWQINSNHIPIPHVYMASSVHTGDTAFSNSQAMNIGGLSKPSCKKANIILKIPVQMDGCLGQVLAMSVNTSTTTTTDPILRKGRWLVSISLFITSNSNIQGSAIPHWIYIPCIQGRRVAKISNFSQLLIFLYF